MNQEEINEQLRDMYEREDRENTIEHRDVLLAIASILKKKEGQQIFKYLFKHFEVGETPEVDMKGEHLHGYLGLLRAGNAIFKLASEADSETAASLLAKLEREKYERKYEEYRIKNGLKSVN